MPDMLSTNICFGGPDLRTAYITLSGSGRLVACDWPRPGLRLKLPQTAERRHLPSSSSVAGVSRWRRIQRHPANCAWHA